MADPKADNVSPEIRRIVEAARDVWVRRLIDYSRANSLLFYRDLKVGTMDLTGETEVVDRLLAGEALGMDAFVPEDEDFSGDEWAPARRVEEARRKVQHTLVAINRKAVTNREEKGIETLHLAVGMATWSASDGGRPYEAPVLLLPARIEMRGRTGDDIRLVVSGEPLVNPVLLHLLEENHAVRVNASAMLSTCGNEDESGHWRIDPNCVLSAIEHAAGSLPGFTIKRRVILANFQFAKMAMVEDLKKNADTLALSGVVAAIAGHPASRQKLANAGIDIEARGLDDRPPAEEFLVLDADSTQQCAITVVSKGQSTVVQGPPGTGKSQTIANLIAQSVAEGRRVLFVAEKRAALDAVIKRLSHPDVALGHLVLDLHGASVSRKEVISRLAHSLEEIRHAVQPDSAETVHRDFEARRRQLNDHARRVNAVRQPTGSSVNRIIGRLLRLPEAAKSRLRLRGEVLSALTGERVEEVKQWILEGSASPTLVLGTDSSPWNNADIRDGGRAQEALDLAAKSARELWPAFEKAQASVVQRLEVPPPSTLDATAKLLSVLRDAQSVRKQYDSQIFSMHPGRLAAALEPARGNWIGRVWAFASDAAYREARKQLITLRAHRASVGALRLEAVRANEVLEGWRELRASSDVPVVAAGETEFEQAFETLSRGLNALGAITEAGALGALPISAVGVRLRALASDQRTPFRLPAAYAIRSRLATAGLTPFLDDVREECVAPEHWVARFEYIWLYSAFEQALALEPSLASFSGRTHEQAVAEFSRLDRERIRLGAGRVRRLHAERAVAAMNEHFDQANLVRTEAHKKSRHIPLRELLSRAPDVLTRIAPCWVASPLSVSQLLDGAKGHFDIVVFDEASQILQEEAVPSLYRADQVVVAGDRHQLPPTTFFATAIEGEDDSGEYDEEGSAAVAIATAAIGGFESLLGTLEAFLPNRLLEWHYRSEDERLIAFSNTHVYSGRLVTFPSARGHQAIRHTLVTNDPSLGNQNESASREVEEVVRQVLLHAETRPDESLGVITMGIKHAIRVQAALDRSLELRPDLADFFSLENEERFFVKNIETVQGDERDAIILSIGYGKAANGDLPHRFGPLTQDVGYRRLNVAVTRAKRRISVVSSFSHQDIDLNRSGSRGVQLLKAYLEYAASGGERLPQTEQAGDVELNAFEADIRDALEARGVVTRPQFGASRYRIDLVAMHPGKAGRPVLAIECDGATYHSGATARDRDRLRQTHLQKLGWRFHRIWSTDWLYGREQEIERAMAAYEDAVRRADLIDQDAVSTLQLSEAPAPSGRRPPERPSARARGPRALIQVHQSIDAYGDRELRQIAEWVSSDGLLRTDDDLIKEIFAVLPFQRMGGRIRDRLSRVAQAMRLRQGRET